MNPFNAKILKLFTKNNFKYVKNHKNHQKVAKSIFKFKKLVKTTESAELITLKTSQLPARHPIYLYDIPTDSWNRPKTPLSSSSSHHLEMSPHHQMRSEKNPHFTALVEETFSRHFALPAVSFLIPFSPFFVFCKPFGNLFVWSEILYLISWGFLCFLEISHFQVCCEAHRK